MNKLIEMNPYIEAGFEPSFSAMLGANLQKCGSLLQGSSPSYEDLSSLSAAGIEISKVVGFNDGLPELITPKDVVAGGVCALSRRESRLATEGNSEDPVSGVEISINDEGIPGVATVPQIVSSVGMNALRTVVVTEAQLWLERVVDKANIVDAEVCVAVEESINIRNKAVLSATNALRSDLTGGSAPAVVEVKDADVLDRLEDLTDEMLAELRTPSTDRYRLLYAGMYTKVWRKVLQEQGIVGADERLVIFEPWEHFAPEPSKSDDITLFRDRLLEKEPIGEVGSPNEMLGYIAYLEPRNTDGSLMRDKIPVFLLPNTENWQKFDLSRFPIVTKSKGEVPSASDITFVDDLGSMRLNRNPAYMWGLVYPSSQQSLNIMGQMALLNTNYKLNRTKITSNPDGDRESRQNACCTLKSASSAEMAQLSTRLIAELERLNEVMFGGIND